jgi:hypothetical protein
VVVPAAILGLLVVGGAVAYKMFHGAPAVPTAPVTATAPAEPAAPAAPVEQTAPKPAPAAPVASVAPVAPRPAPAPTAPAEPPVDSRQLMVSLASLDIKGPISAEDAQAWKKSLRQLIHQGASSIPSIREYLAQNVDVNYTGVTGADQLGYSSLRAGLLDALAQIGGPDATTAMLSTLQSTVFPQDIATLAASLEQQSPGQYQNDIMSAVRNQLSLASQDQLNGANVGPLFQLLASAAANGVDVSADLGQYTDKWPYYSAIDLANLPNGAGLAALMQMAQDSSGVGQSAAAQELADLAPNNPQALNALLDMVRQGQLPDNILAQLGPYLTGRENELPGANNPAGTTTQGLHIANGNQDFSAADMPLTPDQINQRINIINQLIQNLPGSDTSGLAALQQAKGNLQGRLGK